MTETAVLNIVSFIFLCQSNVLRDIQANFVREFEAINNPTLSAVKDKANVSDGMI